MSDPLSISSSIVAFVDAAAEFKETISKVNVSKGKLYHLKTDVERGLSDIEQFCSFRHAELNKSEALELKSTLDEMRRDLTRVNASIKAHLAKPSKGLYDTVTGAMKTWLKRSILEDEVGQLNAHIRSSQIGFLGSYAIIFRCISLYLKKDRSFRQHGLNTTSS